MITCDFFNSCKSLTEFWNVLGKDDGQAQGYKDNEGKQFPEFLCIIEAKDFPIHAWLTHPEAPFGKFFEKTTVESGNE